MRTVLTAASLITPLEQIQRPILVIEDGVIEKVTSRERSEVPANARVLDFPDAVLAPGFVDIHIHGSAGHDVMSANAGALEEMELALARRGVTSYLPTTVTASLDDTLVALDRLASAIDTVPARSREFTQTPGLPNTGADRSTLRGGTPRAQPLGIHLEGPFISHGKRGVHPEEHLREPSLEVFDRLWNAARGHITLMTVAPELPKADYLIGEATRRGVTVSLGHSEAEDVEAAMAAGARHVTHTFNAMRALEHRRPGILGAALADDRLTADIIADGIHVAPELVKLFLRAKGVERAVLITDATSATGMGDGRYRLGGFEVAVRGGRCERAGRLAGSVLTMDAAVRNAMAFAGRSLQDCVRLATLNPARVAGFGKGRLVEGADADVVVLSSEGRVVATMVGGVVSG